MKLIAIVLFASLSLLMSGCSSLQTSGEKWDRYKQKRLLRQTIDDTREAARTQGAAGALVAVSQSGEEEIFVGYGDNPIQVASTRFEEVSALDGSICFFVSRAGYSAKPTESSCATLASVAATVIDIQEKIKALQSEVERIDAEIVSIESSLETNSEAIVSSFQLAATSSNITVVQAEQLEAAKNATAEINRILAKVDSDVRAMSESFDNRLNTITQTLRTISNQISRF